MRTVPARRSEFEETDKPPQSPIRLYGPDTREVVQTYSGVASDCASSHYGTLNVGCDRPHGRALARQWLSCRVLSTQYHFRRPMSISR